MPIQNIGSCFEWLTTRNENKILFAASFHICTITLVSMSIVGLPWFSISGGVCLGHLTLSDFFWYSSFLEDATSKDVECINTTVINMMRITLALCFLIIVLSLGGFFMNIFIPKNYVNRLFLKYAIPGVCTGSVILVMIIVSISCYIILILEDSLTQLYPKVTTDVTYGPGFYFLSSAGVVSLFGMYYTLNMIQDFNRISSEDDQCLIDAFDDNTSSFNHLSPPPPYNVPPPPYTP
ncbi:transmembrane protein 127-like [Coccinella septempunctata]|uniref:transmembrane protein 127-like n=1 Tax=Coccinella septempunctata TaxID=41139 RepID=UPI001D086475|nr:transmembrane protein 127-like [Coccinella septempunctata]